MFLAASCAPRALGPATSPADKSQVNAPAQGRPLVKHTSEQQGPPRGVTVIAGGDVTLGYHYEEYFDEQVSKGRSWEEMFAYGFAHLNQFTRAADIFVVNLECPLTARGEKLPKNFNFRARPEFVSALLAGGVRAVSLANNHMMDYGAVGLFDTLEALDGAKVPRFGAGRNLSEARKPAIVSVGETRFAFLGYLFLGEHNIEPVDIFATESKPGVAGTYADENVITQMVVEDIERARTTADVVIPFFHWGREGRHSPEPYQTRLARAAVGTGASMVLGSHPHVLQGMELYAGVPVVYSLGNLLFGGNWNPKPKETVLLIVRFRGRTLESAKVIPLHTDDYPRSPVQPYPLSGAEADEILEHLADYSREFPRPLLSPPAKIN
jgi:poly-gamma-glutamate synthesis protein (capsule biosynthesis protein)